MRSRRDVPSIRCWSGCPHCLVWALHEGPTCLAAWHSSLPGLPWPPLPHSPPLASPSLALSCPLPVLRLQRLNTAFEDLALQQKEWEVVCSDTRRLLRQQLAGGLKQRYSDFLTPHV